AEIDRGHVAFAEGGEVARATDAPRQFHTFQPRFALVFRQKPCGFFRSADLGRLFFVVLTAQRVAVQVEGACKAFSRTDGPGDRGRVERQLFLDFIEDFQRVARLAVHLVDEGDDGNV